MNSYDSERLAAMLEELGFLPAADTQAGIVILNTCSVRANPQHKVASHVGKLRQFQNRKGLPAKIGIMGCVAQQEGEQLLKDFGCIDFVLGTDRSRLLPQVIEKISNGERIANTDWEENDFSLAPYTHAPSLQSYVTIMKGCNNFCSYCIVPYVRGREQSRLPGEIMEEVRQLVANGTREITLLGQNVNSYGKGLHKEITFAELLAEVAAVEGLLRLRYMTSHPKDFSSTLVAVMAEHKNICPYIHLPVQSGSNSILRQMKRGYTKESYLANIYAAREIIPNLAFSSDIITGFPGETDEDFADTLSVIEKVGYESVFAFGYSPRPGTEAAKLTDDVPQEVKSERLAKLIAMQEELVNARYDKLVGTKLSVLVEGLSKRDEKVYTGRTLSNRIMNFTAEKEPQAGKELDVTLTEVKRNSLFGKA